MRSIKIKSGKYSAFSECPGDLHAPAYVNECMAKAMGTTGMYHCLSKVLHPKNDAETFDSSKFQEGNLASNAEACRDIAFGYGLACFCEFQVSKYYPTDSELKNSQSQGICY